MKAPQCSALVFVLFTLCLCFAPLDASNGDRTQFFINCRQNCERQNCSSDGIDFQEQAVNYYQQTVLDKALKWNCADECQYGCMWRTVEAFRERGWQVPQFYGKWPFMRLFGLQEPASVVFSLLNLFAHCRSLLKFRRKVRYDSPCYKLWHVFAFTCIKGWIFSTIFHTRDFPLTELLDYAFAYSMVLVMLYCMVMRMMHRFSLILRGMITIAFLSFYINYFAYLTVGKFSYALNMAANVGTGILSALGWFAWCYAVRNRRPYYKRIVRFYFLLGLAMSLELADFPPFLWTIDAHALWHLATVPLVPMFYEFTIEDCRALRKERQFQDTNFNKEI